MKRLILPLLLAAALSAQPSGINQFAANAYRELAARQGNFFFSPLSISTALRMALAGAHGRTAAEMSAVLGPACPPAQIAALVQAANAGGNELLNATSLWVRHGFPVLPEFRHTMESSFHAPLDFFTSPEQARSAINSWTAQHTRDNIRELFGPGSLGEDTRVILASAVYYYGQWQSAFRPANTQAEPFHAESETLETSFMHQSGKFGYNETPSAQVLEMKYAGTGLAFDAVLPKRGHSLADVENAMTAENLDAWLGGLQNRTVEVALPKFRAESEFSLRDILSRMGMPSAFTAAADFSGIDDRRDLYLSAVEHKAFVDVSEKGTRAAAATGAALTLVSMQEPRPIVFRADHPFAFLIRDTRSGLILFAGRLAKPAKTAP